MPETVCAPYAARARRDFEALIRRGVFKPVERFVCRDLDYEERVQEGLGLTYRWYEQQVRLGKTPDVALAVHACRMRTVDRSHRLDSGDRRRWTSDVYHRQGRGGVELRRIQQVDVEDDLVEQDEPVGLAEAGCQDPRQKLDSALDLDAWLQQLPARDRTLLGMRQAGYGLVEIGKRLRTTSSTVWKHAQDLGHELAGRAEVTIRTKRRRRLPRGLSPALRDAIAENL
jgi:hypothetical protein